MDLLRLQQQAWSIYDTVSVWCYENQTATDVIAATLIIGSVLVLKARQDRMRRRLRRIWWGKTMRRTKNRLAYEKTMIAMNLEEMLIEMAFRGELTDKSANEWRQSFKNQYNLEELNPRKSKYSVMKSIKNRIKKGVHKVKPKIPEGQPHAKADPNYKPVIDQPTEKPKELGASKWAA